MIPIFFGNLVGPAIDVTSRMTFLSLAPGLRTRLTTIYIVMMFIGGAIGSIAGTAIYDVYGWTGTALYVFCSCLGIVAISLVSWRIYGRNER